MPNIVDKNLGGTFIPTADYQYKYAEDLNLKPGSELHQALLTKIYNRARESNAEMSKRFKTWNKIDESLTAFVKADDAERLIKDQDSRKPISIVVPYSYATLETLLTYMTAAFLDTPIFRYEGTGPEDVIGAMMLEKTIEIQCAKVKAALNLHTAFRDGFSYGLGVIAPSWITKWGKKTVIEQSGFMSTVFQKFFSMGPKRVNKDAVLYEGNSFRNIDPYLYLPDPNVPADSPQKGEYIGWIEPTNYMQLLEAEKNSGGVIFNVKYLQSLSAGSGKSLFNKSEEGRNKRLSASTTTASMETRPLDVIWLYITIIPREWKIGKSDFPEKWLFGLAADKVVIAAAPMNLNHNMYPVGVCVPDSDGYSVSPVSRLEMIYGLQETLDWMFNSHIANVRKSINDMLIVDPSLININDLKDPAPGKLLRMRRAAWGRGVDNAVKQLQVNDITKNHVQDSTYITDLIQKCTGSVDAVMGFQRKSSERVSATESRDTRSGALSRLAKAARLVSLQMMQDLGYMVASHTQQLMSQELYVNVTGRWQEDLMKERNLPANGRIRVSPFDLAIDYDVFQKDGSIQGGEDADLWIQLFQIIGSQEELLMQYDTGKIFMHIARQLGAKDVSDFIKRQPNVASAVLPDGTVSSEAQAGNLVPANQLPQPSPEEIANAMATREEAAANVEHIRAKTATQHAKTIQTLKGE